MNGEFEEYALIANGERFNNADGTSRQSELARCVPGERIDLLREPTNPHDPMAVALISVRGVQVGYLNREYAQWIGREIDEGRSTSASVLQIASKGRPGAPVALTIKLRLEA